MNIRFWILVLEIRQISKNIARTEVGVHAERRGQYSFKQYGRLAMPRERRRS